MTAASGESGLTSAFLAQGDAAQYNAPSGTIEIHHYQSTTQRRRPWMTPALSRRPIDRPELTAALLNKLAGRPGGTVAVTTALHGAGGFGKTTLASYVCSRSEVRELFPGGLLWITIGQDRHGPDLASAINDLCEHLTGTRPGFVDPEQAGHNLGALLEDGPPTLLVIDDVWDDNQLRPLLVGGRQCIRLITTRIPGLIPDDADLVHVDQMEQQESEALLSVGLPGIPWRQQRQLLEITGRWPLLLALANGALRRAVRNGTDAGSAAQELVDRLAHQGPTALDVRVVHGRDRAVEATMAVSLALLDPRDRERYLELAIFAEDVDIPQGTLAMLWQQTGPLPGSDMTRLMEDLADLSLLAAYQRTEQTIRLHDVLRLYLRHRCGADRLETLNQTLLDAAQHILEPEERQVSDPLVKSWWRMPPDQDYLWQHLCYHLAEAGEVDQLAMLVADLRWAAEKSRRYDVAAVEVDLARVDSEVARELRSALAREAHVLGRLSPAYSHGDLIISRLQGGQHTRKLVEQYRKEFSAQQLRIENYWPLPDHHESLRRVFVGHSTALVGCAISPDGGSIATCGLDNTIRVWSRSTGQQRFQLSGHTDAVTDCTFSPDGLMICSASRDGTIRIWDAIARKLRFTLTGHVGSANACVFGPDGTSIVSVGDDGSARHWEVTTGRQIRELQIDAEPVLACAIGPDEAWIVTTGADGRMRKWEIATSTWLQTVRAHLGRATTCVVSPDGATIITGGQDNVVRVWDAINLRLTFEFTGHTAPINECAVSPDGRWLASVSDDQTVRVWDLHNRRPHSVLQGHSWWVSSCSFSSDGSRILSSSWDQTARLWRLDSESRDGTSDARRARTTSCSATADSAAFITGGRDGTARVWSVSEPQRSRVLDDGHGGAVLACDITSDGRLAVTAGLDHRARIWNVESRSLLHVLEGHTMPIEGCCFAPDTTMVVTASQDGTAIVWRLPQAEQVAVLAGHSNWVSSCSFSRSGDLIATTSWDRTTRLWKPSGELLAVLDQHDSPVLCCTFSPDDRYLVTGGDDGTARVQEIRSTTINTRVGVFSGHARAVTCCAVSPDQRWLVTGSKDATLRVWSMSSGINVASMRIACEVQGVCWCTSDTFCAVGDSGLHVFRYLPPQ
ncbi:NB-ARC domain-containing protein [Phytohabitans aurantiacus]|uniref:NB-ARC domain-containing protein n=1 Tax=Phytohabitans aurantiacus TaxID=3016789 RepID=A0ABQ5RAA9_9ACTN|nr:NB-ARC domain-containing protein [Phytohabitans aurantiacus]GLI02915.1 hypothetical protein Pa4123_81930 [Phytohabitans aurantiacus]